jgi:HNH endonuclease
MTAPQTIKAHDHKLRGFTEWLVACGAVTLPTTNQWEVLRVKTCFGTHVTYTNKKQSLKMDPKLYELKESFLSGKKISLSPDIRPRARLKGLIMDIAMRDGLECWFTGQKFTCADDSRITVEHLCPRAHGGPDHMSNLVLATQKANQMAGNLSVALKVRLREKLRTTLS